MSSRATVLTATVAILATVVAPALASTDPPPIARQTDNLTLLGHLPYQSGSDMQFQRREGPHPLDGTSTDGTRDYLFAGTDSFAGHDRPADGIGVRILDVTDPASVRPVAEIPCTGYHSDIAVYEDLLVQTIDDAASNGGCEPGPWDPHGIDQEGRAGLRIFDVSDPARPEVVRFVAEDELLGRGVHNVTVVPWAGLLYLAATGPSPQVPGFRFGYVDLTHADLPVTMMSMHDISPTATNGCHDIGVDPARELAFCAATQETFIWDIAHPRAPAHVSTIVNPAMHIHHGARMAPDGRTLVLNDEMGGGPGGVGCLGAGGEVGTFGALWFYDVSDPASPALLGSFATEELDPTKIFCTSHWYNFVPDSTLLVVGWYRSGMLVVDYADPASPSEHAAFLPEGAHFWSAYFWRGALYGNAFESGLTGPGGGGLWVLALEGVASRVPTPADEGTSWARWTASGIEPVGGSDADATSPADGVPALPATGRAGRGALASLSGLALAWVLSRRRAGCSPGRPPRPVRDAGRPRRRGAASSDGT